ncbi:hypothetical protein [Flavihumibacter fluvii]
MIVASTPKGICFMAFNNDEKNLDLIQQNALFIFIND